MDDGARPGLLVSGAEGKRFTYKQPASIRWLRSNVKNGSVGGGRDNGKRRPLNLWIKWSGIVTYFALAILLLATTSDRNARATGSAMIAVAVIQWGLNRPRIDQAIADAVAIAARSASRSIALILNALIRVGILLGALYLLVRFVKWAWTN